MSRISHTAEKGPAVVIGPEDGESYWQPLPSTGYATVKLSPHSFPSNLYSAGIQVLEPGAHVREHAHQRNEEMLFVYEGRGRAIVDGVEHTIEPGSMVMVGRYVQHKIVNEGDTPMKMLWVIFPPGLENWFAAIGRPRAPGDPLPTPFERPHDVAEVQRQQFFVPPDKPVDRT